MRARSLASICPQPDEILGCIHVERIAIFAALQWECRAVVRQLRCVSRSRGAACTFWRAAVPGREIWVIKTAVGEERAAAATNVLRDAGRFDLFFSTGCAGALSPQLTPGDLTVATTVIGQSARFDTDSAQRECAVATAQRAALPATVGPVLCSPRALVNVAEKRAAALETGAIAVEMEGAAIAAVAQRVGIPFLSVRAVLDTAETELPEAGDFMDPQTGSVKLLDVLRHVARQPAAVSELFTLQRMMSAAQRSLEIFFQAWLAA